MSHLGIDRAFVRRRQSEISAYYAALDSSGKDIDVPSMRNCDIAK